MQDTWKTRRAGGGVSLGTTVLHDNKPLVLFYTFDFENKPVGQLHL